jgi:predicted membrane-bound mannosyltransferase
MTNKSSQLSPLVLALVLLAIFAVLILGASSRYMREDEAIALEGTAKNIPATILRQINDVHGPLYFVSFYLWQQVIGHSEFTGRVFSLLTSMLTVSVVYLLGRR